MAKIKVASKPTKHSLILRITTWISRNRIEAFFLFLLLLGGAVLRLYRIDEYMTFLGDEGRDAIIVRRLLVNFDPILVGPGTSIGNMYLGPLYYYLIAPFLLLANFSPVGPSVMVALLSIATIWFIWYVTNEWFGKIAAFIAALLYAISPIVIIYSRSSWNPNIMPFFSLLSVYSIWRVLKFNEFKWLIVLGFSLAMALNSHYLALLIFPVVGLFWLIKLYLIYNKSGGQKGEKSLPQGSGLLTSKTKFVKNSLLGAAIFAFLMSPLLIFDARHEWRNLNAIKTFFTERQTTVSAKPWNSLPYIYPNFVEINTRLLTGTNISLGRYLTYLIIGAALCLLKLSNFTKKLRNMDVNNLLSPYLILFVWLGFALVGLGVYKQEIYDHYYGFFFTAPFMLFGALTQDFFKYFKTVKHPLKIIYYPFYLLILISLLYVNFENSPLKFAPNRQLQRSEEVAQKIIKESNGQAFNLGVIAERNYEGAYQYFLEKVNAPIKTIDPQLAEDTITEQLFVVCELPKDNCDPTHDPKAGIANFGWSKIEKEWEVTGVNLFKLVHY